MRRAGALIGILMVAAGLPVPVAGEAVDWAVFERAERGVRISYPKSWHVLETDDRHPYVLTIEPTPPNPDMKAAAPVVLELFKYYHASMTTPFGQGSARDVVNRFADDVLPSAGTGVKILSKQEREVQGAPAWLVEMQAVDPRQPKPLHMLVLAASKDDVLATLYCQAPAEEFEAQRAVCEQAAASLQPFSADPTQPDNAAVDALSTRLANDAVQAFQSGDAKTMVTSFEQAVGVNPADAQSHLNYGSLLLELGKHEAGDVQSTILGRAEQELRLAAGFFEIRPDVQQHAPLIAQAYYLLGEIAYFGRKDADLAKKFYQAALGYHQHPAAAAALQLIEQEPAQVEPQAAPANP